MPCEREECRNELPEFEYIRLKKRVVGDEEPEEHGFCSIECAEQFLKEIDNAAEYRFYEVSRCPAYYYCEKIGNLRVGCEEEHRIEDENVGMFHIPELRPPPICRPAEAGLILATSRFDETSTQLNQQMLGHTKTMKSLTWAILGFTIVNLILISIQIYVVLSQ